MTAWRVVPCCLFWTTWKERNRIAFENIEKGDQVIKQTFMHWWIQLGPEGAHAPCIIRN